MTTQTPNRIMLLGDVAAGRSGSIVPLAGNEGLLVHGLAKLTDAPLTDQAAACSSQYEGPSPDKPRAKRRPVKSEVE